MNWTNQTIWTGDNLPIMRGMNSANVVLIYLDPPFNSKANYAAPIGSEAAGAEFKDTWTLRNVDIAWLDLIEQKHPALNRVIHAVIATVSRVTGAWNTSLPSSRSNPRVPALSYIIPRKNLSSFFGPFHPVNTLRAR